MAAEPFSYVLVCHSYPPVLGGSEIEAQRVSDELQKRGHHPRIVCAGGDPMPPLTEWIDPFGLRVRLYGGGKSPRWRDFSYALGVAWTLFRERKQYDVVYFLMQGLHLTTGLPMARLLGKPIVMKFSCSGLVRVMQETWMSRLQLWFLRKWAQRILILNPGMAEEALEVGFDKARLGWMPNPVDTDYFRPGAPEERTANRKEFGIPEHAPLIVFVGRLDHQKKLPWILGSWAKVARERPQAKLALVGDGPLRSEVVQRIEDLGLQASVLVVGRVPSADVLKWHHAADACLLVSEVEGLPCALIEAMSAGVPPVVSDIPAHSQMIDHEVEGILTKLGDEASIAAGIIRVIDDPELRARMSIAARRRAIRQFSTDHVVDLYESLFEECKRS